MNLRNDERVKRAELAIRDAIAPPSQDVSEEDVSPADAYYLGVAAALDYLFNDDGREAYVHLSRARLHALLDQRKEND